MNRFQRQDRPRAPVQPSRRHESLSEQRYADMLKSASALFASADVDTESVRRAAIDEINELMTEYGLTVDDLQ